MKDYRHEQAVTLGWMDDGEVLLAGAMGQLADDDLAAPSALPGWSRAHVLAHLARNADALGHLVTWARTGIETPMYADPAEREAGIEMGAQQDPERLRADVASSATALREALSALPEASWVAQVRSARGRIIPATEIPWMRARELWLHTVDLQAPEIEVVLPDLLAQAFLVDICEAFDGRSDTPPLTLVVVPDGDVDLTGSRGNGGDRFHVHRGRLATTVWGRASDLVLWLTGRASGASLRTSGSSGLPPLPQWL